MKRHLVYFLSMTLAFFLLIGFGSSSSYAQATEENTLIYTAEDLASIGDNPSGNYVLMNDIDLSESEFADNWSPIGTPDTPFSGTFDGNSNEISGINIISGNEYIGLFGYISSAEIKDLTVSGSYSIEVASSSLYLGGIAGYVSSGSIHDCSNHILISAEMKSTTSTNPFYLGGITGYGGEIDSCINESNITTTFRISNVGGITGYGAPTNCKNKGTITGGKYVGGIAGQAGGSNCENSGDVFCNPNGIPNDTGACAGGIVGYGVASYSTNSGNISCNCLQRNACAGGISGASGNGSVQYSKNYGQITATHPSGGQGDVCVGGIIGCGSGANHCSNYGNIYGSSSTSYVNVGGICGYSGGFASTGNCCNFGTVEGNSTNKSYYATKVGGISGSYYKVSKSYNAGTVISSSCAGGITGCGGTVTDCYNIGSVSGSYSGGLAGYDTDSVKTSYNVGTIKGTNKGGVVGHNSGIVEKAYFLNSVSNGASNDEYIGESKTLEQLKQQATYSGYDFSSVWKMSSESEYYLPTLIDVSEAEKQNELTMGSNIALANIVLSCTHYIYDGNAKKPNVTVSIGSQIKLVEDRDYTISYSNNINKGTGKVHIEGKGEYAGSVDKLFDIHAIEMHAYKKPTCDTSGNEEYYLCSCGKCYSDKDGKNEIELSSVTIEPTGHNIVLVKAKEPSCVSVGNCKYWKCTKCDEFFNDSEGIDVIKDHGEVEIETTGHSYGTFVQEPTCTQKGYTLHICARCGDTYYDTETDPAGHDFSDWSMIKDSTCSDEGYEQRECKNCGFTQNRGIIKKDHEWASEYVLDSEPTCTENGSKSIHCIKCGAIRDSISIPSLGHEWEHFINNPSIGVSGKEYDKCSRCSSIANEKTLPALNPSATTITKLVAVRKGFTVKWAKKSYTGYQLRYSLKSSMASPKTVTISKASTLSKKVTKLKAKKKYYVQVRTYKTVNGKKWYSTWSAKKAITTKK